MADWQKKCAKRQCYEDNRGRIDRILGFWGVVMKAPPKTRVFVEEVKAYSPILSLFINSIFLKLFLKSRIMI